MVYGDLLSEAIRRNNALMESIEEAEGKLKDKNRVRFTEGVAQINLYHGLHSILKVPISYTCDDMVFSPLASEYLVLVAKRHVVRYDCLGRQLGMNYPLEGTEFTRVMWAYRLGLFLCWQPDSYIIYICKKDFTLLHRIESEEVLQNLLYDESTKEIFAVGKELISVYRYHEGTGKLEFRGQIQFQCADSTLAYIQTCCLGSVQGNFQRIYASYFGGVYVVDVNEKSILDYRKGLHSSHITAMLFYKEVMWLITGDVLGTVKCWDLEWKLLMVFAGHEGTITHLLPHPGICGFITSGHDQCLTAWSCTLRDKVEMKRLIGRARAISLNWKEKCVAVLSDIVEVWRVHNLYDFHATLSAPPTMLYTAMNPCYPSRTIVLCADSSVRLFSPVTGVQLTVQILPSFSKVQHAGYSSHSDILYTSVDYKNRIMLSYCDENPVKFWKAWRFQGSYVPAITSLAVFEHIARDRTLIKEVVEPHQRKSIWKMFQTKSTILFLGREDGTIAAPHATDGCIQSSTKAHECPVTIMTPNMARMQLVSCGVDNVVKAHECPVTIMTPNMARMQLVSCGVDNVVKVWRVFPYLTEGPLLLMACIYYNFPISFVTTLTDVLCLGATGDNTVSHIVIMYDLSEKVRYDHPPKHDHSMKITSMTSNVYLALCATASLDGTIRIWNEINELEKILELNAIPSLVSYSSLRGDITLAIGRYLYKIPYAQYLSPKYRYKIESFDIPDAFVENAMPFTKENLYDVSAEEDDLVYPSASVPLFLPTSSGQQTSPGALALKQLEYFRLDARNSDIQNIVEGNFEILSRIPPHRVIGSRSWRMLIQNILLAPVEAKRPDQADMNIKELRRRQSRKLRCLNLQAKFKARYGRSYTELTKVSKLSFDPLGPSPPVTCGFLPNSVLFKLFEIMSRRETGDSEAQRRADAEREKFGDSIRRNLLLKLLQVPEDQKSSLCKKKSSGRRSVHSKSSGKSSKKGALEGSTRKKTFVRPRKIKDKYRFRKMSEEARLSEFKESKVLRFSDEHDEIVEPAQDMLVIPPDEPLFPTSDVQSTSSSEDLSPAKEISYAEIEMPSAQDTTSPQDLSAIPSTKDATSSEDVSSPKDTWSKETPSIAIEGVTYVKVQDTGTSLGKEKSFVKVRSVKETSSSEYLSTTSSTKGTSSKESPPTAIEGFPVRKDKDVSPTQHLPHVNISKTARPKIKGDEERKTSVFAANLARKLADGSKTDTGLLTAAKILYTEQDDLQPLIKETLLRSLYESRNDDEAFKNALNAIKDLKLSDVDSIAAVLALHMMGRKSIKDMTLQFLEEMGLQDPDGVLPGHLENWHKEIANKELDFDKLRALVTTWLLHWMKTLEYHVNQVISQIQDGELTTEIDSEAMHRLEDILDISLQLRADDHEDEERIRDRSLPPGDIAGEMMDQVGPVTVKGLQPREQVKLHDISHKKKLLPRIVPHLNDPQTGIPLVLKGAIRRRIVDVDLERNITEMTVVLKPGLKLLPHCQVRPLEALGYFCELKSRAKHMRMRHLDACMSDIHIAPEDKASPSMKAHLPWKTHLHRPMSTVFPNPFNTRTAYSGPVLLTLRTSYKYFCPKASVPQPQLSEASMS